MADLCTQLFTVTLNTVGCFTTSICQPPTDGQHSICMPAMCPAPPIQYDCVRADGAHYLWEPSPADGCGGLPQAGEACKTNAGNVP